MKSWLIPMAAGFGAGILSAWGVGGGTLLLLVMTLILGVPQQQAAAVNLLYFLPTAAMGVIAHKRNGLLETETLNPLSPGAQRLRRPVHWRRRRWTQRYCGGCSGHICCWRPPAACGSYGGNEGENSRKFRQ